MRGSLDRIRECLSLGRMAKEIREFRSRCFNLGIERGKIIFEKDPETPESSNKPIPIYYWKNWINFGDAISPFVVRVLSGRGVVHRSSDFKEPRLLAVGSVLHDANEGDIVWGSGFRGNEIRAGRLDVRAVRGPLTRAALVRLGIKAPQVYGDPAVLMPYLFDPRTTRRYDVGVIQHLRYRNQSRILNPAGLKVLEIRVDQHPLSVISQICECRQILSSSLHGIIVADAYGIPSRWIKPKCEKGIPSEPDIKFEDYYASTGRMKMPYLYENYIGIEELTREMDAAARIESPEKLLLSFPFLRKGIRGLDDLKRYRITSGSCR